MVKIILKSNNWIMPGPIVDCRRSLPAVPYVAFVMDGMETWQVLASGDPLPSRSYPIFMALHGLLDPNDLVEPWAEDPDVFNVLAYRQNPKAVWEMYYWDNTECLAILEDGMFRPNENFKVQRVRAIGQELELK